jgi:hypothetical protein
VNPSFDTSLYELFVRSADFTRTIIMKLAASDKGTFLFVQRVEPRTLSMIDAANK